ncbi:MAG: transcriptional repressor [Micavibrio sp.]|nr:transcriptional repressor [Micavibrio sp.]|tara:strand:- start:355 stop:756 length:402 start_codon:yes stop_codon:yes gene_type:complete
MTNLEKECVKAGLKMTGQRKIILNVLSQSEDHPSVEEIYERSKEIDSSISMATVYRTIGLLHELDLVIRHDFKESFARYELNHKDHYHLIDMETGKVIEFESEEIERLKEKIAEELGYEVVDYRLELYGKRKS